MSEVVARGAPRCQIVAHARGARPKPDATTLVVTMAEANGHSFSSSKPNARAGELCCRREIELFARP